MLKADADPSACPFCGAGAEASAFAQNAGFLALYDISPVLPGHSLILPRRHVRGLLDLGDGELADMMVFGRAVTRVLVRAFKADGFDWAIQDGAAAGQTVPHLHLHVIPRHTGDLPDPGDWYPALMRSEAAPIDSRIRPRLTPTEFAQITEKLRAIAAETPEG
jgi:bis(5'-adenosyl)-triphosphatase